MTDLERFAAALLTQWRADGGTDGGPIAVSALLGRVFPYRVARRTLGIDVSEDYEALVLRLLSEEEDLVRVEPVDAADMARATISSKLPDLDVLQLLRAATVTLTARAITRLDGVLPMPSPKDESKSTEHETDPVKPVPAGPPPAFLTTVSFTTPADERCWSCAEPLPGDRQVKFCPFCGADQRQPTCTACGAAVERNWKHCAECGAKR